MNGYLLGFLFCLCYLPMAFLFFSFMGTTYSAAFLSMFVTAAIFYVVYRCRKEKKDKQLVNHHVNKIALHLGTVKKENFSYREIKELEEKARQNLANSLMKYNLGLMDLFDTHSSLGYCAFKRGYLLTSFEFTCIRANSYLKNLDLYKYFTQSTPIVESRKLKELAKYIDDPRTECSLTPEDFEALEKYISIIVDSATHNIALSNIRAIKTKDIAYYKIEGGTQFVADVKGGGANLAGAVYGGIIAGGAGAVVGSNLGTEIKTDIVRKDDRKLFLYYNVDGELKSEEIITDNIDRILSLLREWIPNKEYSYVVANSNINTTINETKVLPNYDVPKIEEQTVPVKRSYAELKELKELLDLGIITQAEFDQKKREILG